MRDPNSTLGVSALTAIEQSVKRAADRFSEDEKLQKDCKRPGAVAAQRERARREQEAEQWIAEVRARRGR